MKKRAIGVLSTGALAVAAALATSYHIGQRIQQEFESTAQAWSTSDGFSVRVLNYQRGITSAQATSLWSFATEEERYEIPVIHHIVHGPWPWGKAAKISSQFQLPNHSEPQLLQALKKRAPLEWVMTADWQGATEHHLTSPNFAVEFEDASSLMWGGLNAQWDLSAQRDKAKGAIHMPAVRIKVEDGNQTEWEDTELTFDARIPEGHSFWEGPAHLKIGLLAIQEPETATDFRLQQLQIESNTQLQDQLVQMRMHSHLGKLETPGYNARNVVLNMRMNNIHVNWFDQLVQQLQRSTQEEELAPSLWDELPTLLSGKPELAIEQLDIETDEGTARLAANLQYVGTAQEALDPATDLLFRLQANLPKPMLRHILETKVRGDYLGLLEQLGQEVDETTLRTAVEDGVNKRLKGLLDLGAVQDKEGQYAAELVLEQGEFKLNGQPTELQSLMQLGGAI